MGKISILICNFKKAIKATFSTYLKIKIMAYDKEELLNLPTKEKLDLVEALWDSIEEGYLKDNSIETVVKELDRRVKYMDDFPETLTPWEKVKEKMQ